MPKEIGDWEDKLEFLQIDFATRKIILEVPVKRISIPQINYVSWMTIVKEHNSGNLPPVHHTIDIPIDEPTSSELDAFYLERFTTS